MRWLIKLIDVCKPTSGLGLGPAGEGPPGVGPVAGLAGDDALGAAVLPVEGAGVAVEGEEKMESSRL